MPQSPITVVALGARAVLRGGAEDRPQCSILEYAILSDGRRVHLTSDRGWGGSGSLRDVTIGSAYSDVLTAVLPDDAEQTGETHEWAKFVDTLTASGVDVDVDHLRGLTYTVDLFASVAQRP